MRTIAVFDFDGTITKKDTFIEFIRFCFGSIKLHIGFFILSPYLILYKLKLYPNYKAKEKVFSYFFKGVEYNTFCHQGETFAKQIESFIKKEQIEKIKYHQKKGHDIYIVSASIKEWIEPWCNNNYIYNVISTEIEVNKNGYLTGKLKNKNCYGSEKVKRFLIEEPLRESYYLYAYGDSKGDIDMINFADKGYWCK